MENGKLLLKNIKSTRKRKNNQTLISHHPSRKSPVIGLDLTGRNSTDAVLIKNVFYSGGSSEIRISQGVLEKHISKLCESLDAEPGCLIWLMESFSEYKAMCADIHVQSVSLKTFRRIASISRLTTTRTNITGKGHIISLKQTASKLLLYVVIGYDSNAEENRAAFRHIA